MINAMRTYSIWYAWSKSAQQFPLASKDTQLQGVAQGKQAISLNFQNFFCFISDLMLPFSLFFCLLLVLLEKMDLSVVWFLVIYLLEQGVLTSKGLIICLNIVISQYGDLRYAYCTASNELQYIHRSKMTFENCQMVVFSYCWLPPGKLLEMLWSGDWN